MADCEQRLSQVETAIRSGQLGQARALLQNLPRTEIPRASAATAANLARRCGYYAYALRLLNPLIRPAKILDEPASERERIAYAATLIMIGASREGMSLLASTSASRIPEAIFFQSLGLISQWKYGSAIPVLRRYLQVLKTSDYAYWVGATNLAAALIVRARYDEADALLEELRDVCQRRDYRLLLSNNLVLAAQSALAQDDRIRVQQALANARQVTPQSAQYPNALIDKWSVISDLHYGQDKSLAIRKAFEVRAQSIKSGYWENVRDIDFHLAKAQKDEQRFLQVYWGSPFKSYRRKIKEEYGQIASSVSTFFLANETSPVTSSFAFTNLFKEERLADRLARVLLTDHYQPLRVGHLFSMLYPDQYFDPFSSVHRIEQGVYRFRNSARRNGWGIDIVAKSGGFKLQPQAGVAIEFNMRDLARLDLGSGPQWIQSHPCFRGTRFTRQDVVRILGVSSRSAQRLIKEALLTGSLEAQGSGRSACYFYRKRLGLRRSS